MLQEEQRAIKRYIDRNNLKILSDYPKDGVFKDNEYFKTSDGLYFQVVDSGNGTRIVNGQEAIVRFKYRHDIAYSDTSITYWTNTGWVNPFSLLYRGIPNVNTASTYTVSGSSYECGGWIVPLQYVGEQAIVNMIIPSAMGSSVDNSNINPVFYDSLKYTNFW